MESATAPDMAWAEAMRGFEAALRGHFAASGRDPADGAATSTLRTNTELVPRRARNVLALSRALTGVESLTGLRVLELGCGFGALAAYLTLSERPAEYVAVDMRPDYVTLAAEACAAIAGPAPRFAVADMRTLDAVAPASFDLAIYNNSFIYLPDRADMRRALRRLAEVLRPGGRALFYHANRLAWREPFTRDPLVHLLAPSVARRIAPVTGWRHNHGRVRLVSPDGLRLMLYRAGFRGVRHAAWFEQRLVAGVRGRFARYYGVGATLPGSRRNGPGQ